MKRALMYASVASMIQQFNMHNIRLLQSLGYQVDVACNMEQVGNLSPEKAEEMKRELEDMGVEVIHIPIPRSITALRQIFTSLRQSKALMNERNYSLIHCHSPIGGMVCRLANRFSRYYRSCRMIYTAHGFHFFQGAPVKNWLMFYPVEWLCAHWTETLITINKEDYALAQQKMKARNICYVPGIGVDTSTFTGDEAKRDAIRKELGIPDTATFLLSVGELNHNKNHQTVLQALSGIDTPFYYAIAGTGVLKDQLLELIQQQNLQDRVSLLGFRSDVPNLLQAADVFVFPSLREGLSVALMEAMAAGKAVACSQIRGNTDLIDSEGGCLFPPKDVVACKTAIETLLQGDLTACGAYNRQKIRQFSVEPVLADIKRIYQNI